MAVINKTGRMNEPYYKEVQDFYISDLKKPTLKEVNIWPCSGRSSSSSGVYFSCPHVFLCLSFVVLSDRRSAGASSVSGLQAAFPAPFSLGVLLCL